MQLFVKQVKYLYLAQNSSAFTVLTHVSIESSIIGTWRARSYTFATGTIRRAHNSIAIMLNLSVNEEGDVEPRIAQRCMSNGVA
jgi:hypothetical protein